MKTVGQFELEVWTDGSPVWVHVTGPGHVYMGRDGKVTLKFTADHISDLRHALTEAEKAAISGRP